MNKNGLKKNKKPKNKSKICKGKRLNEKALFFFAYFYLFNKKNCVKILLKIVKERRMKTILYFVLAVLTIGYIALLCYCNVAVEVNETIRLIANYGGLAIMLAYAAINFFGNPLKIAFFILLVLATVFLILTAVMPDTFRELFHIIQDNTTMIKF